MKTFILFFALSSSAFAATNSTPINSIADLEQLMAGPNCLEYLEYTVKKAAHPSPLLLLPPSTAVGVGAQAGAYLLRKNLRHNLAIYENWVKHAERNLKTGHSNIEIYRRIENSLRFHRASVIGRPIAGCISAHLQWNGSVREQLDQVRKAKALIQKLKEAVN